MAGAFQADAFQNNAFQAGGVVAGTTLAALQAGSGNFKYVVSIEGYQYLLTNATSAAVLAGWAGGDWSKVLTGLYVDIVNEQKLNPWEPFQGGGQCTLRIVQDAADTIGIDTHRTAAGAETYLTSTIGRSSASIAVRRSDDFAAAPADAFIGAECFEYSAKPDTTHITASKRGKYAPFPLSGVTNYFSQYHRVGIADNGVGMEPVVTQQPRSWVGKWVGVWLHKWDGSAINAKADALCVFAGTVTEIRDDPDTLCTTIAVKHVLDTIKEITIGRDIWHGTLNAGINLSAGQIFKFADFNNAPTSATLSANDLLVVASSATGTNQINAGQYTSTAIASAITSWLAGELAAARIYGKYSMGSPEQDTNGQTRTRIHYYVPATGSTITGWTITFPDINVANFLGYDNTAFDALHDDSNTAHADSSQHAPQDAIVWQGPNGNFSFSANVASEAGTMVDQYATLPASCSALFTTPKPSNSNWGAFLFDEKVLIVGRYTSGSPSTITNAYLAPMSIVTGSAGLAGPLDNYRLTAGNSLPTIRQIFILDGSFATLMKQFFYSSGTAGYNESTFDVLPYNFSVGIPNTLLSSFQTSCDVMPGASSKLLVMIDKPTKFADQFAADFVLRRANLIWKSGGLQLVTWATPSSSAPSLVSLPETTKAEPAGNQVSHRASTTLDATWQRNIVKVNYNRDITSVTGGGAGTGSASTYRSTITLEDPISVDDQSGQGSVFTLDAKNVYSEAIQTGVGLEQLLPLFLSTWPPFSRAVRKITRSIDMRYFEGLAPGDLVSIGDKFARDPVTGKRGITARPGLVVRHKYTHGGSSPSSTKPTSPGGEIDVIFFDVNRIAAYAPTAQVDDTQNAGGFSAGYSSGTSTLRCYAHKHSEASEIADASNFVVNDVVTIVEMDPAGGGTGIGWVRIVQSVTQSAGVYTDIALTVALSSPAWDATKKYRIFSAPYTSAQTSQTSKAYQAGSDGTIKQLAPPDQYGLVTSMILATSFDHTTIPELIGSTSYLANDGRPLDTGTDRALSFLLENLMDHKTAKQNPSLFNTILENTTYSSGNGYQLMFLQPITIGQLLISNTDLLRYLYISPFFRSSTGAATTIRISISGYPPVDASMNDVTIKAPAVSNSWTTSSTAWQTGAEAGFPLGNFNGFTTVWLIIEAKIHGQCRGLAQCIERERVMV